MFWIWLIILIIYGLIAGWDKVGLLSWLLLIVLWVQDSYDAGLKKRIEELEGDGKQ